MAIAAVSPRMVVAAAAAFLRVHLVTAQAPRNHGKREDGLGQSVRRDALTRTALFWRMFGECAY